MDPVTLAIAKNDAAGRYVGKGSQVVNVMDYGAVGDGSTDDTAFFQAAVDALPRGGTVFLPPKQFNIAGTVSVGKAITFAGASQGTSSSTYGSSVTTTSTSTVKFNCTADGVQFENIRFVNSATGSTVTDGAAIRLTSGIYQSIRKCRFSGFWRNIDIVSSYGWVIDSCIIFSPQQYGICINDIATPDAGDQVLSNSTFDCDGTHAGVAAVYYGSGGGLKVLGTKILHHVRGLDLQVGDGQATSVMVITGNSLEGQTTNAIRLGRSGTTGTFNKIVISGNHFNGTAAGGTVTEAIRCDAGTSQIAITSNYIEIGSSSMAVRMATSDNWYIGQNTVVSGNIGVQVDSTATDGVIRGNKWRNNSLPVVNLSSSTNVLADMDYVKPMTLTSTSTWVGAFRVALKDRSAASFTLNLWGTVNTGVSGTVGHFQRTAYQPSSGANLTLTTVGTDSVAGPTFDIQFDTTTTVGSVIVSFRNNAASGGASISAGCRIQATGGVERVVIL